MDCFSVYIMSLVCLQYLFHRNQSSILFTFKQNYYSFALHPFQQQNFRLMKFASNRGSLPQTFYFSISLILICWNNPCVSCLL